MFALMASLRDFVKPNSGECHSSLSFCVKCSDCCRLQAANEYPTESLTPITAEGVLYAEGTEAARLNSGRVARGPGGSDFHPGSAHTSSLPARHRPARSAAHGGAGANKTKGEVSSFGR